MESRYAVVHYAEIGLKGRNRGFFERALARRIEERLQDIGPALVARLPGRLLVQLPRPVPEALWVERLRTVFGIAYFAPAIPTSKDLHTLTEVILHHLPSEPIPSFRVRASRTDKSFPVTSQEIERHIGAAIQRQTGWRVNLSEPAWVVYIEIAPKTALVYFARHQGPGGLPVGVSGRVGLLLSGGIDSPVAAYFMLKRGCEVIPIHFHSGPFGDWAASEAKAMAIVRWMRPYGMPPWLYVVPIGELQRAIVLAAPASYRLILYRRLMVRIAEALTRRENGKALVTGDSLGQVASQTLESLSAIEDAATMPILRPLIGLDKVEIIDWARRIGTYGISILPGEDCCQFLMPPLVVTRPSLETTHKIERRLQIEELVQQALAQALRIPVSDQAPVLAL
ncbi:MAG: tRNA uracil 4-sulfurtransferase ThiI [Anaerolineae bacterium]|nr:tRNA 4-thiouridine(8) synthase ThiI [Thermoflexus sp.]MDW8064654.1 tRNA uracil 4-sulfurtransferase ThiI [Anaerolineae bacterium]